ncbi:mmpL11 [Symbiodinium sp. CCMP2456]|nr:mmpL11 [Symbiodinium sp. CCMP2456]
MDGRVVGKLVCRAWYQRLLVLPLVTVGVAFVVSALMLLPWMDYIEVPPDGIAAMGSVILALSLDTGQLNF